MARKITEGFEAGDLLNFTYAVSATLNTTSPRSGVYTVQCYPNTSFYKQFPDPISEYYTRYGIYTAKKEPNQILLSVRSGASTSIHSVVVNATYGLNLLVGSTVVASTESFLYRIDTWYLIELHGKIHDTEGVLELKVDGNILATYTGDTKPGADTTVDTLLWLCPNATGFNYRLDDIALNDTTGAVDNSWCGDGRVIALTPTGNSATLQWTPSAGDNYACVDDVPPNSTDYVSVGIVDQKDIYTLSDPSILDGSTINRVWVETRAKKEQADEASLRPIIVSYETEYAQNDYALTLNYTRIATEEWLVNPNTAAVWTIQELTDLQSGVVSK